MKVVFDIEADGLLNEVTKIHCLSYQIIGGEAGTLTSYKAMKEFLSLPDIILIGHHIIEYDIPVIEKILKIKITGKVIDTLGLSWYLFARRVKHGLESWGEELGVPKPKIEENEWLGPLPGETFEDFIKKMSHRCQEDVKINTKIYEGFTSYLEKLYPEGYEHLIQFLNFKKQCFKHYSENGFKFNERLAQESYYKVEYLIDEKLTELKKNLPKVLVKKRPQKLVKKDGSPTAARIKWETELKERGLPINSVAIYEDGNPGSFSQVKNWLIELGWKPQTFKEGANGNKVPQLSLPFGGGICPSVKELYVKEPSLELLEGLFVLKHRLGIFKSFLESKIDGRLHMRVSSLTNTIRLQHSKPLVNLPSVYKDWGKEIRGCLAVPSDDYLMFGADISGLESSTSQHFMYFFDPKYVKEMRTSDYDPHTDIAVVSGLMTKDEESFFKWYSSKQ